LSELNVIEQVLNLCQTTIVEDAWLRGQDLTVHGWIYALTDGKLRDLRVTISSPDEVREVYERALAAPPAALA
jgi:carbonic anhydrase